MRKESRLKSEGSTIRYLLPETENLPTSTESRMRLTWHFVPWLICQKNTRHGVESQTDDERGESGCREEEDAEKDGCGDLGSHLRWVDGGKAE